MINSKKSIDLKEVSEHIKRRLDSIYPIWRNKLQYFFPYAPASLLEDPPPELILLLGDAFNILNPEESDALKDLLKKLLSEAKDGDKDKKCKKCGGSGKSSDSSSKEQSQSSKEGSGKSSKEGSGKSSKEGSGKSSKGSKCSACGGSGKEGKGKGRKNPTKDPKFKKTETRRTDLEKFLKDTASGHQSTHLEEFKKLPLTYMYSGDYEHEYLQGIEPCVDFALSNLFKKRLLANSRAKEQHNLEEGELDPGELIGAVSGRRDVFCQYNRGKSNKVSVIIGLDHSGSMDSWNKDRSQGEAVVNIISALDRLRIPNCILTYGDETRYIRLFGDSSDWKPPRGFTGSERPQECYHQAVNMFQSRQEKRKILLMFSDGAFWPLQCLEDRKRAKAFRVETYAFSIGTTIETMKEYAEYADEHSYESMQKAYDRIVGWCPRESTYSMEESIYNYMDELIRSPIYG
jgi:hypothetical protein